MKPSTHKKNKRVRPLRKWIPKANHKVRQKGGFLPLLIAGLVSLGMSAGTAATVASVAAPVLTGALTAAGGIAVTKLAGKGMSRRPLMRRTARRVIR